MRGRGPEIEEAITLEDWSGARRIIRAVLRRSPADHWLLARLALTHYEERDYARALKYAMRAAEQAPYCPLVLWEIAGAMDMLEQSSAALRVYGKLTRKSLDDLAYGPCGEGLQWARGIMADGYYRIGRIHERQNRRKRAIAAFEKALSWQKERATCIYARREIQGRLRRLQP
jgi:tetratricopeptide (TPR) repeat protein